MLDEDRMMREMATDLVMTFMPKKGKTPSMIEAEIQQVHDYLRWETQQPIPEDDDEDAFDPESGLLKEASTMPFFERWAQEARTGVIQENDLLSAG